MVPWADRLWVITYAPHSPRGSNDKLYEFTPDLEQIVRAESIGGTPANRMIHKESNQLFIGPYAIDSKRNVRSILSSAMFGRLTANARHLTNPAGKILYATMEEGIYEVDTKTLDVTELWGDEQSKKSPRKANLPGYHGKGFYSGQGVYLYANNGQHGAAAKKNPETASGVLAEWDGEADKWTVVRRNQFTEITGPGGINGSSNPATDPIWAIGWDYKSLIMGVRMPKDGWNFYRLPKGSHSYDGAHGWNTEWARIREVGQDNYLMTMHGTFWQFPKTFTTNNSAGIKPLSNYLKVIGDFAPWKDKIVFGCDDTAKGEFLNKRKAKGEIPAPQSQSNLWFVEPDKLDSFGPAIGRGLVWSSESIHKDQPSDPYLFSGYDHKGLHLQHTSGKKQRFTIEIDRKGDGNWSTLRSVEVPATGYRFVSFDKNETGIWIRIRSEEALKNATAAFSYRNYDARSNTAHPIFAGISQNANSMTAGVIRARGNEKRDLAFAAVDQAGKDIGFYMLDDKLELKKSSDTKQHAFDKQHNTISEGTIQIDRASAIYIGDNGKKWRLPKGDPAMDKHPLDSYRIAREVATERDLLNAHGTFYELPARNAGDINKIRAIATHNCYIHDFCSYRGLLILSGIANDTPEDNQHILRSDDGKVALWAGAIDDIWKLGKPRGKGGPWLDTAVKSATPSDPYLMTGYDKKSLILESSVSAKITAQVDLDGTGHWVDYHTFKLEANKPVEHQFQPEFQAYWVRFVSDTDTQASAQLSYE